MDLFVDKSMVHIGFWITIERDTIGESGSYNHLVKGKCNYWIHMITLQYTNSYETLSRLLWVGYASLGIHPCLGKETKGREWLCAGGPDWEWAHMCGPPSRAPMPARPAWSSDLDRASMSMSCPCPAMLWLWHVHALPWRRPPTLKKGRIQSKFLPRETS